MTEDKQTENTEKSKKTFSYKSKKRRVLSDANAALNASAKSSVKESSADNAATDKQSLIENYTSLVRDLEDAYQKKADLQNATAVQKTQYAELSAAADAEISQMQTEHEQQKQADTQAFIAALKTTESSLQIAISEIKTIETHQDLLSSFVEGLEMTAQNLSGIFNSFTARDVPAPAPKKSVPAPAEITAETFEKLDLDGKDKEISTEDLTACNATLSEKLTKLGDEIKVLEETQQDLAHKLENAEAETTAKIERSQRDLERQSTMALKKPALQAVEIADQLSLAQKALGALQDKLGNDFNSVSAKIEKLETSLSQSFADFGLAKVKSLGEKPDYDIHQVIGYDEATKDIPSGHIVKVEQDGYTLNRKPLRDAMVRIAG